MTGWPGRVASVSFLNNRYHDPTLGRFISVDPLVSQTHDAYGYGHNNPTSYSDPSGLEPHLAGPAGRLEDASAAGAGGGHTLFVPDGRRLPKSSSLCGCSFFREVTFAARYSNTDSYLLQAVLEQEDHGWLDDRIAQHHGGKDGPSLGPAGMKTPLIEDIYRRHKALWDDGVLHVRNADQLINGHNDNESALLLALALQDRTDEIVREALQNGVVINHGEMPAGADGSSWDVRALAAGSYRTGQYTSGARDIWNGSATTLSEVGWPDSGPGTSPANGLRYGTNRANDANSFYGYYHFWGYV
jgi:hypothetical protein